ncbi:MAG: dihydrodipicolinate synthase family protein [Acidobacteriota bacterium]|nr:dihydrodipicolinate synthase family protein [Acidobacteriota bacterium]
MSLNLNGIIAALPTPFGYDGEVDREQLRRNVEKWNLTDLHGYLILGSTGEFTHLTADEKQVVIETVRGAMSYDKLLLVGTGELSTRQTIEMTRRAHDHGADGAVVITPFYYKKVLFDEHHIAHYERIADSAPIPTMIYMIPQFAGVTLMPETIAHLAEHPNIIGLKESSGDLPAMKDLFRELKTSEFSVLVGSPAILHQSLEAGCSGAVLAVGCLAPNTSCAVRRNWQEGNYEKANELQTKLAKLGRITSGNGVGHLKAALDLTGYYGFMSRSPLPNPTDEERKEIADAIAESELFDKNEEGIWIEKSDLFIQEYAD